MTPNERAEAVIDICDVRRSDFPDLQDTIANAVRAAVAEERERCIKFVRAAPPDQHCKIKNDDTCPDCGRCESDIRSDIVSCIRFGT